MIEIRGLAFSVDGLRRDADEIEACGGGNEAAHMRWAANELDRLRGLLTANGIDPGSEFICQCGIRREAPRGEPEF